jgi:hypothetical protein
MDNKLRKQAQPIFDAYPELQELIATIDGNFFTPDNKQHAINHAKTKGIKWVIISRETKQPENGEDEKPIAEMTVKEVTKWTEKQNEVSVLQNALEKVDIRGSKIAIENRIKFLTQKK